MIELSTIDGHDLETLGVSMVGRETSEGASWRGFGLGDPRG